MESMGTTHADMRPKTRAISRGVKCSSFLATSCHRHLLVLLIGFFLLLNPFLHFRLFASTLSPSSSLRCPCPASYHLFSGGSDAYFQARGLVMLLPRCADMPEFALPFNFGTCLLFLSFPYLAPSHVLFAVPEQSPSPTTSNFPAFSIFES